MELRRKAYDRLLEWKNRKNHKPIIVEGLRQVGKSYIVSKFAEENYNNVITFDFRHNKELINLFNDNLSVDEIISNASVYFPNSNFIPNETVLVFEEIGDCPLARTSLKSFALDGRFEVIATGSFLGVINYRHQNKVKIPAGYEDYLGMSSLDFEEFLWAFGINEEQINVLKKHAETKEELNEALAIKYRELMKIYIAIGGMPEVITTFIESNKSYIEAYNVLSRLLRDYRSDFGRFVDDNGNEQIDYNLQAQLNVIFDTIPKELARCYEVSKFHFSEVKKGYRASSIEMGFDWLEKSGLVLRTFNVKSLNSPLALNVEENYYKAFISDPGLLMAAYPISVMRDFINGTLGDRKGAIYENLAATMIKKAGFPLYYFADGTNHLEIDFLIEGPDGLILFEEKSTNSKMAASRNIMENKTPYQAKECWKVIETNFGVGSFYVSIPHYSVSFVLDSCMKKVLSDLK